ncbi:hypothetical protein [Paenibacillus xylanexedens]|uniref:hypothetical protein n=1 Tax=Paenibacillus xylanexedens TaxID=528191 RepID=UPI000FB51404|nr:hypothetical protein [Paenibacillus xylanexedens]RPK29880.1 hypothetical protein EDO6_00504 [Paenibacillus xylanexedens]
MKEIGAKLYYEKSSGNMIMDTGERAGDVVETTVDQDFSSYLILADRVPESVGLLQLEYGAYKADYEAGGNVTRIDLETMEPLFTYSEPVDPEVPQEPRPPLSKQVEALEQENVLLKAQNTALSERADFVEDVIAEMATQVYK